MGLTRYTRRFVVARAYRPHRHTFVCLSSLSDHFFVGPHLLPLVFKIKKLRKGAFLF